MGGRGFETRHLHQIHELRRPRASFFMPETLEFPDFDTYHRSHGVF